jgi:hypothetical protein
VSDGNEMLFISDRAGAQRDWWSWAGGCSLELTLFFLKICPQFASTHHYYSSFIETGHRHSPSSACPHVGELRCHHLMH